MDASRALPWASEIPALMRAGSLSPGKGGGVPGSGPAAQTSASLQMGYLRRGGDGNLVYSVVNAAQPDADGGRPPALAGM